jgi:hypothetical protein
MGWEKTMSILDVSDYTIKHIIFSNWMETSPSSDLRTREKDSFWANFDLLHPIRVWLDNLKVDNPQIAHRICTLIPSQCPFARQIKIFGRTVLTIPPLCKLNPLYEELMSLRFRAICYLADECGEDISIYC